MSCLSRCCRGCSVSRETSSPSKSEERWWPKRAGGTHRTRSEDREVVFPTPRDEAKWKEQGSPKLLADRPRSVDDNLPRPLSISNMNITMRNVGELPTSKKVLAGHLRAEFAKLPDPHKEFDVYSGRPPSI